MCIKTKACGEKEYHLFNSGLMVKDLAFKHGGERMWRVQINVGLLYIRLDINPYMYHGDFAKAHSKLVFNYFFHYSVIIWTFETWTFVAFKPL
jgi:hypothetical protein